MARRITIDDDDSGVVTTVVTDKDESGVATVREISFVAANGTGLAPGSFDLPGLLADLGLTAAPAAQVPAAEPEPATEPEARTSKTKAAVKAAAKGTVKAAVKGKPGRRTPAKALPSSGARQYRRAPDVAELQRLYLEHGGPAGVARALDVPVHSVNGWLRGARNKGHEFVTA